jgi:hypothetical protein
VEFAVVSVPASAEHVDAYRPGGVRKPLRVRGRGIADAMAADFAYPHERVGSFCAERDIPFVNLSREFARYDRADVRRMFLDHWSPYGHAVVSEILGQELEALLPADARRASAGGVR